ncbi:proline--tRNA ligase [Spiribacter vilamensis]|uniref:Proline--tRNA ligase n=1 Tax=Spiribacter vilamensis TaxID=531306 RepID=A0A4Q8D0Z9_9GAMM|nr:proline--tRNA ligase [Spiribacter vilamensis]RZU98983.1 prolyl-tRNA synthetase [Spiribacter vilamensis]TVO62426.1 proline--tRNA ligase [Spiribacter vilamensis]
MRTSRFPLFTSKDTPADADIVSHQLMVRAGLVKKLGAGLYTWQPLGLRVMRRVERIVREEMNRINGLEVLMPAVQPAELWEESGRWSLYGPELLRLRDRHERSFCIGPTHEEVITDYLRQELRSYRQLPVTFYQIQTKFRDEIRPRFGVMRAREFVMKDAYSFHIDQASLEATYQDMHAAYSRVFSRLGLRFRSVGADSGAIGGSVSEEFMVLADSGEDEIASCSHCDYAANTELAASRPPAVSVSDPVPAEERSTPGIHSVAEQCEMLDLPPSRILKSVVVMADENPAVLFVAGDDELNEVKAAHALGAEALRLAEPEEALAATGVPRGFIGPRDLPADLPQRVDYRAAGLTNFSSGAGRADWHWINLNWDRDMPLPPRADLRTAVAGEGCPRCDEGHLEIHRGIEVGHIFQLGTKYSEAMDARVLDEHGTPQPLIMGCYGIGVSRVVAAAIEQNHDDSGIIWPAPLAPFDVALVSIGADRSPAVAEAAATLYERLCEAGFDPLWDDRDARPGVKFADMELIGIPHRIVIGDRGLAAGTLEYRARDSADSEAIPIDDVTAVLQEKIGTGA